MARNVYLDPFGTYTSAFDKGLGRQMDVENNRRQARAADFSYNYMLPLEYDNAQITNSFNRQALPYNVANLDIQQRAARAGLANSEYALGQTIARDTGVVDPALGALASYLPGYGYQLDPETGVIDWTRDGQYIGKNTVDSLLGRYLAPESLAEAERQRLATQQQFSNDVQVEQLENNRRYQEAMLLQAMISRLYGGGAAGLPNGGMYGD